MPITINNYNFSNAVYEIMEGGNIPGEVGVATITISPNSGHTVTAADFSLDPSFSNEYVSSVAFTQSGDDVICSVTFVSTSLMPAQNVTIPLCVIGEGVIAEITIAGTVSAVVGSNVTGNGSETNTPYSNSGAEGDNELMFSRTYNAASGYYWASLPSINIAEGNQSNYNIVQTPTFDSNNRLTNIAYAVNYIYPSTSVSGDRIVIDVPSAQEIYNPLPKIISYIFDRSIISAEETTRLLTIIGVPGTPFSATLNDGVATTIIINNGVIGDSGTFEHNITFPGLLKGASNKVYTIEITGSYVSNINKPNPFTVEQMQNISVMFDKVANLPVPVSGWTPSPVGRSYLPLQASPFGTNFELYSGIWLAEFNYDILPFTGAGTLSVTKSQIDNEDFVNFGINQKQAASSQTAVTSLDLNNTTDISAGDFGVLDGTDAPYLFEVISVNSSTNLTISSAITVVNNQFVNFYKDGGTKINVYNSSVTKNADGSIRVYAKIATIRTGNENKDFDLKLSNIIAHNPATAFGMTNHHGTGSAACADTSYTNTVYVTNDEFEVGKTVYTNYNYNPGNVLTTPFIGNGGFYAVNINPKIAIKINSSGTIIDAIYPCP